MKMMYFIFGIAFSSQILVAIIKNLIIVLKNMFEALLSIVIPSLLALGTDRDPDEVIRMTPVQSSWLCE